MKSLAEEAARLVESLPADKARALIEFARYLADRAEEEGWDRRFGDPKYAPRLKALMAQVESDIDAGKTDPLDPQRL